MTLMAPRCFDRRCTHFLGVDYMTRDDVGTEVLVCRAFPVETGGIPDRIANGKILHAKVVRGQVGTFIYEGPEGAGT
jgi:hypothetical protein